ncbi:MAG: DUF6788 family protein [Thermoplasmata archaeon]
MVDEGKGAELLGGDTEAVGHGGGEYLTVLILLVPCSTGGRDVEREGGTISRALRREFERHRGELSRVGFFLRGSVVRRFMPCGRAGCRCQGSPPRLHGPYYQWTRKVRGKTVTVRLTPEVARVYLAWIKNGRGLDDLLAKMEKVSERAVEGLRRQGGR